MPPRAKRRRAEVAQALQAMGAEPRKRAVRAEPIVAALEIDREESSEPGTSEQQSEKGWLNISLNPAQRSVEPRKAVDSAVGNDLDFRDSGINITWDFKGWRVFKAAVWRKDHFLWPWSFLA
ncbi:hypothetical protein DPMN_052146 [Dreissena polymorpha]|uniref:Uncharacterized protein n=1 Tax=Dreissena polymorpha TaxID=45954 RepID=A0A9D4CJ58_DREPO|nr:hypothetical protein DPMN_052146 [Dreissena polymorpha]